MRIVLGVAQPLLREVLDHVLTEAGLDVVGHASSDWALLTSIRTFRPDVVFLMSADPSVQPGICTHVLSEYPDVKIVVLSIDRCAIVDVGIRRRQVDDLSIESIRGSLLSLLNE
jgi:DNA-binding NarL/FixJ family response regulator